MPGGVGAHFAMVDQATNMLKKVEQYLSAGIETTIDVALDYVEHNKESDDQKINELKETMLQYAQMERDLKQFLQAVDCVKDEASHAGPGHLDLESILGDRLKEMQKNNNNKELESHEKYIDLVQKIQEMQNPEMSVPTQGGAVELADDADIAMTQQEVNTMCPFTRKEMSNPVTNQICRHSYEKEGILQHIKSRGKRAKCPVAGCVNEQPISEKDLKENKELKRYIERKNREAGKRSKRPEASFKE